MRAIATIALLATVLAVASASGRHVFFTRSSVPSGWTMGAPAPKDAKVGFMIALKQRNLEALEALFWAVSTPGSPQYQQYQTIDQILELVAPEHSCHDAVVHWLRSHGHVDIRSTRDALEVTTTVEVASKLFETKFHVFRHADRKPIVRSWGPISMPSAVNQYVDLVEGLTGFPVPHNGLKMSALNQAGDTVAVVPQTLNTIYSIPAQTAGAHPETSVGVIEFQGQSYSPQDSVNFSNDVKIKVIPVTAAHTIGPNDPTNPQIEAALDIEMVATVGPAATAWFWLEDGQGWLYQYVNHFFNTADVPQVVSISYGWSESDQCDIDPDQCQALGVNSQGYVYRVNAEFQKIALRGISVLVSSGDSGANGRTDPDCTLPYLKPAYPAACPYVTAVGATQLNNPKTSLPNPPPVCVGQGYVCASGGDEVAVSYDVAGFASGGGFANYAAMPSYQTAAVNAYFNSGVQLPPSSYYNATGRGYPDVAAIGNAVLIDQAGVQPVGGTSASAPEFAAVVSILNAAVIKKTGKPLGFLNNWLYQTAAACPTCFHDITVGDNICTEDGCSPGCQGFKCTKGWDPVTGLGSPNTQALLAYINTRM